MTLSNRFRAAAMLALFGGWSAQAVSQPYDVVIKGGQIYDGSGASPYVGDIAVRGDRISYVGPPHSMTAKRTIDAHGQAVAPGFINMLSQAQESMIADGREESDLFQGVTLEVMGEGDSMGPLTDDMAARNESHESDIKYPIDWRTLGQYLQSARAGRHVAQYRLVRRRHHGARLRAW